MKQKQSAKPQGKPHRGPKPIAKKGKPERKDKQKKPKLRAEEEEEDDAIMGSDYDQEMAEVEDELNAEKDLDETIFDKFGTGELDLGSEAESDDPDASADEDGNAAKELDDYYRELGIDPEEMKPSSEPVYSTREKKESQQQI